MKLGSFSVSIPVKDIKASKEFYEKIGFEYFGGNIDQNWLIMKNGDTVIGLFQGMFDKIMLTFNPGWDQNANTLESFEDVRVLKQNIRDNGIEIMQEGGDENSGPGSFVVVDPDGNPILFDQHI